MHGLFMRKKDEGMILIGGHAADKPVCISLRNNEVGHTMGSLLSHHQVDKCSKIGIVQYRNGLQRHHARI